jgi:predicted RND superfamily exporter protein
MASVHLSFATTLVGTGVMIFAHHPALFLVGVSLTSGLVVGYLTAFFVIPGIYYLMHRSGSSEDARAALALGAEGRGMA